MSNRRVRLGIDVGGTFTKAVAIDARTGEVLAKSTVPTTHASQKGVSEGIVCALYDILQRSDIQLGEIEIISHSTTQAINALLESDVHRVGVIAMGVGPTKSDVIKRTRLDSRASSGKDLKVLHEFLDTSHLISEDEVQRAVERMRGDGAEVIVATEAFGVDDPSNEAFVMKVASKLGMPSTSSHEISGIYGLEIRTLTAVINASVLPKTFQVADFVEEAIRKTGVHSPLMIMKGDGGVTSMETFKTKPILTILSGPAASVAGALLYLKVTNGIFIEVGGTSTNICIIRNGRPEFRYVTIKDHPTCIRSMDVRIVGVAGGSMVTLSSGRVSKVGPRSAHIAGLKYACFADPDDLKTGEIVMIRPKPNDAEEYASIKCKGGTYAITNTCAANALGMIDEEDYSFANAESARVAMQKLGKVLHMSYFETAQSIIQTSSFDITRTVSKVLKDFKMDPRAVEIIGGGGGASVLVPFVAKQMRMSYRKAAQAEVISSIGVAASMLKEELEVTMIEPTPEKISSAHKKVHAMLADKGAVPESIFVDSKFFPDKSVLQVTAVGNVEMDGATTKNAFTPGEAKQRASEIIGVDSSLIDLKFKSDHYFLFDAHVTEKRLVGKRRRHHIMALDVFGRLKLSLEKGMVLQGSRVSIMGDLTNFFKSKHSEVAPRVYLINDLKMMDFSSLTSKQHIMTAVYGELAEGENGTVIVETA